LASKVLALEMKRLAELLPATITPRIYVLRMLAVITDLNCLAGKVEECFCGLDLAGGVGLLFVRGLLRCNISLSNILLLNQACCAPFTNQSKGKYSLEN